MKNLKRTLAIALAAVGASGAIFAEGPCGARLAEAGRTDYAIVVSSGASACDRFAAEELRRFLGESTGADFPIVAECEPEATVTISDEAASVGEELGVNAVSVNPYYAEK